MKILGGILLFLGFYVPIGLWIYALSDNTAQAIKHFLFVLFFTMSIVMGICLITGFI